MVVVVVVIAARVLSAAHAWCSSLIATACRILFCFSARAPKLQRQSSLCHSCRYTRIHHVPSFLTANNLLTTKQDSSFIKTTSSTNLTESLSSASLVAASAASTLSSAAATTENNSDELLSSLAQHRLSTSSLPFSILNGDSGVYGSRISIADDVYEQLCEKPKKTVSSPHFSLGLLHICLGLIALCFQLVSPEPDVLTFSVCLSRIITKPFFHVTTAWKNYSIPNWIIAIRYIR